MGHLFISYSRQDHRMVDRLVDRLEQADLEIWIDREEIQGGDFFQSEIVAAIRQCDAFIVVLSWNSVTSDYVRDELTVAKKLKKRIVPVTLQKSVALPDHLELQLAGLHRIDFATNLDRGIEALMWALSSAPELPSSPIVGPLIGIPQDPPHFLPRDADLDQLKAMLLTAESTFLAIAGQSRSASVQGILLFLLSLQGLTQQGFQLL